MSRRIFKYKLKVTDEQVIDIPAGALFLSVQIQYGEICVWANVDPDHFKRPYRFFIAGTGQPSKFIESPTSLDTKRFKFLGTVQQAGGALVWHVFVEN